MTRWDSSHTGTILEGARAQAGLSPVQDCARTAAECASVANQLEQAGRGLAGLLERLGKASGRQDMDQMIAKAAGAFRSDLSQAVSEGPADKSVDALLSWIAALKDTLSEAEIAFEEALKMRPSRHAPMAPAAALNRPKDSVIDRLRRAQEYANRGIEQARRVNDTVYSAFVSRSNRGNK